MQPDNAPWLTALRAGPLTDIARAKGYGDSWRDVPKCWAEDAWGRPTGFAPEPTEEVEPVGGLTGRRRRRLEARRDGRENYRRRTVFGEVYARLRDPRPRRVEEAWARLRG